MWKRPAAGVHPGDNLIRCISGQWRWWLCIRMQPLLPASHFVTCNSQLRANHLATVIRGPPLFLRGVICWESLKMLHYASQLRYCELGFNVWNHWRKKSDWVLYSHVLLLNRLRKASWSSHTPPAIQHPSDPPYTDSSGSFNTRFWTILWFWKEQDQYHLESRVVWSLGVQGVHRAQFGQNGMKGSNALQMGG